MPTFTTTHVNYAYGSQPQAMSAQPFGTKWKVTVPPADRIVSPQELRGHARIDFSLAGTAGEDDALLGLYIDAATEYAESRLTAALAPRTIRAVFYDGEPLDLPIGPVIEVVSIEGRDLPPATTGFTIQNYGWTNRVVPTTGLPYPMFVNYRAGYQAIGSTAPAVPAGIKLAILMHAATLYANRESIADKAAMPVPHTLDAFYDQKSRNRGAA